MIEPAIPLYPHQLGAVKFLERRQRAILADTMGLGKSFPGIVAAIAEVMRTKKGGVLLVCPAYLLRNWEEVTHTAYPKATISVAAGKPAERRAALSTKALVTIVNYEMLSRKAQYPELFSRQWAVVIFDEAHKLRGRNSLWTKAAYQLKAGRVYLLTGTPIVNNAGDLFPLLKLCDPKRYRSYWRFVQEHCTMIQTPWAMKVGPVKDPESFSGLLAGLMLKRDFEDVGLEVPPAVHQDLPVDLGQKTRDELKFMRQEFRQHLESEGQTVETVPIANAAALITAMRQLTAKDPQKLGALTELVGDTGGQVIVWCFFRDSVAAAQSELCQRFARRPVFAVTGEQDAQTRQAEIAKFKKTADGILVATIAAVGLGENLQSGNTSIFYECDWIPANNDQAIGRQRRIGQEHPVRVLWLYGRGSVDRHVLTVARQRDEHNTRAIIREMFVNNE